MGPGALADKLLVTDRSNCDVFSTADTARTTIGTAATTDTAPRIMAFKVGFIYMSGEYYSTEEQ